MTNEFADRCIVPAVLLVALMAGLARDDLFRPLRFTTSKMLWGRSEPLPDAARSVRRCFFEAAHVF
jgi:hypothetical protein